MEGFAKVLAEMYDLDTPAGQAYCSSHTTLGFSSSMNSKVGEIERDMKVIVLSVVVDFGCQYL